MAIRILDVGQCGVDGPAISRLLHEQLGAKVDSAPTADEARQKLADGHYHLVLVNRVFAADGSSGVDLIREFVDEAAPGRVMLVSDHTDAQEQAVAQGAIPGFGKSQLDNPQTLDLIADAAKAGGNPGD